MYYGFGPYISVGSKKEKAKKALAKLRKAGFDAKPIEAFGRSKIATTFWGRSWCENLESYADYENRVGRGRSYVRNGLICHLGIEQGKVLAKVNGTSLYTVQIDIQTLARERWEDVCKRCAGQIGSLMELLQGQFSKEVMSIVCAKENGLFPAPSEISFKCSCPDRAYMCKHVAAVLYGIGRRLDSEPNLLFTLRGVDPSELLAQNFDAVTSSAEQGALEVDDVGALFGIDFVEEAELGQQDWEQAGKSQEKKDACAKKSGQKLEASLGESKRGPFDPKDPRGADIRKLRELAGLTQVAFAKKLGVSAGCVSRWEHAKGRVGIFNTSLEDLSRFQDELLGRE